MGLGSMKLADMEEYIRVVYGLLNGETLETKIEGKQKKPDEARANVTREYVSHIERGVYKPTVDVLMRLCAAMNTRARFFWPNGEMPPT